MLKLARWMCSDWLGFKTVNCFYFKYTSTPAGFYLACGARKIAKKKKRMPKIVLYFGFDGRFEQVTQNVVVMVMSLSCSLAYDSFYI